MSKLNLTQLLKSDVYREHPYGTLEEMRLHRPRYLQTHENGARSWFFTTYEDVSFVLKDARFIKEWRTLLPEDERLANEQREPAIFQLFQKWMLFRDPPAHTRLRGLVNKAFTPRMIESLRPRIEAIAQSAVAPLREKDRFDCVAEYAFPIPVAVIAEMLGVPTEDRELFREWSKVLALFIDLSDASEEELVRGGAVAHDMMNYFYDLLKTRRSVPRDDLMSAMLAADERGDRLSEAELVATCILILFAGHETTVNLISNAVYLLLKNPDVRQDLLQNKMIFPTAVDEFLRVESPVQLTSRFAAKELWIKDAQILRGDEVNVSLAAANRDPAQFDNPDAIDLRRSPNRHLAFASGAHFCIGAPLARAEAEIALRVFFEELNELECVNKKICWRDSAVFRGPRALPLAIRR
ncbi:cytochrome P450 [Ferroacidibacillus organovorans]|uniref:Cytochrome P450 n=1 Tax=Ferroacidibacillus organovorans TaxID=1765683 RepID=A0A101XNG6_9BACL|nr:cytochrome P450 [Ferroacidibacillus organovorans]KUO94680.1 hypothetical protein ATW55_02105 [Ferroacidibacillus organovorans]